MLTASEPNSGAEAREVPCGAGKNVTLMLGLDCPRSTMDVSSMIVGRRQSLWVARVSVGQNATAWGWVKPPPASGPTGTACCHMSPVTLSVTVPSPLSVYASGFGAPAATSTGPFGIGHSAQVGSRQSAGAVRPQTSPVEQAAVLSAGQPSLPTPHVCRLAPDKHCVAPLVHAFVHTPPPPPVPRPPPP